MMTEFKIKLAGIAIGIKSLYTDVFEMCGDYMCEDECEADFCVVSSKEGIRRERAKANQNDDPSDAYLETLAVYRGIAEKMPEYSAFLMHGSVVADKEAAYMFAAVSGVGKTTRTNKWIEQIEDSFVVNGDKPLIKIADGRAYACGTPWCGKEKQNTNIMMPLRAVIFLERAEEIGIRKITFAEAFVSALRQIYRPQNSGQMAKTLELIKSLDQKVGFYKYYINLDDMDMRRIYEAVK